MIVSRPPTQLGLSLLEFFEWDATLGVKNLSPAQRMTLKVIQGEPLDEVTPIPKTHDYQNKGFKNELEMFLEFSGKSSYVPTLYSDASFCWGRRSGKSTTLGAGMAIYFATQFDYKPYLGTSPYATIPVVSPTKSQAGELFAAIKNMFLRSTYLFDTFLDGKIENFLAEYSEEDIGKDDALTGGMIKLNNKVVIKVMAADTSNLRGMAVPFAIMDEACFMGVIEGSDAKNTDVAIYEAISPSLAQFQQVEGMAMILKISSPNGQAGLMYSDYENRLDPDFLHLQVPSWYANPTLPLKYLEKQKKKGMSFFLREYGAEYTASESSYLDPGLIDKTRLVGVKEIPFNKRNRYVAVMDYATKNDYWGFGIGHREYTTDPTTKKVTSRVVIDKAMAWKGLPGAELDPGIVIPLIALEMQKYQVAHCLADQYAYAAVQTIMETAGGRVKEFKVSSQSKQKYMYSLQIALNSDQLRTIDDHLTIQHLKDLREKRSQNGRVTIQAANGCHDDMANVVALIVYHFDKTSPLYIGYNEDSQEDEISTKDASGNHLAFPTANELAENMGIEQFSDNRNLYNEDGTKKPEDTNDDDAGIWFVF